MADATVVSKSEKRRRRRDKSGDGVIQAILVVFLAQPILAIVFVAASFLMPDPEEPSTFAILFMALFFQAGWTQLLYLPGLGLYHRRKGLPNKANGVLMVSGILFVLTGICNAVMAS